MSDFCGSEARSLVERLIPRKASAGSECEVIHAGNDAEYNASQQRQCKRETEDNQRRAGMNGQLRRIGKGESQNHARAGIGHGHANDTASAAEQHAFYQHLPDQP